MIPFPSTSTLHLPRYHQRDYYYRGNITSPADTNLVWTVGPLRTTFLSGRQTVVGTGSSTHRTFRQRCTYYNTTRYISRSPCYPDTLLPITKESNHNYRSIPTLRSESTTPSIGVNRILWSVGRTLDGSNRCQVEQVGIIDRHRYISRSVFHSFELPLTPLDNAE